MKVFKSILLVLAILSGWMYSVYIAKVSAKLKEQMIANGYKDINDINAVIDTAQMQREINLNDLKASKAKIDAILDAASKRKVDTLSLDDAMKIIKGVKND